jgi:hypothetical protein
MSWIVLSSILIFFQRLRRAFSLIYIISGDAGFTSFPFHQPIVLALTLEGRLGPVLSVVALNGGTP